MGLKATTNPANAVKNWGQKVAAAGPTWSAGLIAAAPNIFNPANIDAQAWQNGVSSPQAAADYEKGMASVNMQQFTTVVNGAGQGKYTSSGSSKQAKMLSFMNVFIPKLSGILQTLNTSSPKGPRGSAQNRTRLNNYLDAVAATRGQN